MANMNMEQAVADLQKRTSALEENFYKHRHLGVVDQTQKLTGASGGGHIIQDGGSPLPQRTNLNIIHGGTITIVDNPGADSTDITISSSNERQIFVPAEAMNPTVTDGCSFPTKFEVGSGVNYWALLFDDTTEEHAFFTIAMPTLWDGGDLLLKFIWLSDEDNDNTHNVVWGWKGRAYNNGDDINSSFGSEDVSADDLLIAQDRVQMIAGSFTTLGGTFPDPATAWVDIVISRKVASDTIEFDTQLIGVWVYYNVTV